MGTSKLIAAAAIVVVNAFAAPSQACEYSFTMKVVGFNAGNTQALIRSDGPALEIDILDLASGKVVEVFPILGNNELGDKQLRAKRWKALQPKLKKRGFTVLPDYPAVKGDPKPGLKLVEREEHPEADEISYWSGFSLWASRGGEETMLVSADMAPPSDAGGIGDIYLSPDGRYLITSSSGCFEKLFVFSVDDLDKELANKQVP